MLVGITGFEPATSSSRTKRATKLRHIPVVSRTVVRGTRNTIPLGFGLAKTAGCVRFVAGVGAWRWRGGGVAAAWRWRGAARCGLDPAPQKTISGFASSFLQKPRSRSGKIAKSRYRLLGSSRDLRRSRQSRRSRRAGGAGKAAERQTNGRADHPTTDHPATGLPALDDPDQRCGRWAEQAHGCVLGLAEPVGYLHPHAAVAVQAGGAFAVDVGVGDQGAATG